ncbi:MAG TPA: type II toxin-antitoxin system CcdA family antitoxin [Roseomonas sp.]|nr:type II toxin-antitoxin system CcdA family antitoxin [Roseomonas sp.]
MRMSEAQPDARPRRAVNVTLPLALVAEAKEAGVNVSRACQAGLEAALREHRRAKWVEEHRDAFAFWNAKEEAEGLPLAQYRSF